MKYSNGQDVRLGDRVRWHDDPTGIVICSIDTEEYSDDFRKDMVLINQKRGIVIRFERFGLIFKENYDPDLEFIARGEVPTRKPRKKMTYFDGQEVHVGDIVRLSDIPEFGDGMVVSSIDYDEYSEEHPKEQWGYLGKGCMIKFEKHGLMYYEETQDDLVLIERAKLKNKLP